MAGKGRELSPQMRSRICELKSVGYSYSKIHSVHPEIPLSTIKSTCQREKVRDNNCSKPRSGAPRKLTEEQRDYLYDLAVHQNPHITIQELCSEVDFVVQKRSIQRLMQEMTARKSNNTMLYNNSHRRNGTKPIQLKIDNKSNGRTKPR